VTVIIGVDPHKSTHTAVAIDREERPLARLRLVADRCQTQRLLAWAEPLGTQRSWDPSRPRPPLTTRAREDNQGRLFNPAWPAKP